MRNTMVDAAAQPSDREFLVEFCVNLSEPARSVIAKKRITYPQLTVSQLVKLAELEDRSFASAQRRRHAPTMLAALGS